MLNHNLLMDEIIPYLFHLSRNYPNPFKEKTVIKYYIASRIRVQLTIYDAKRRLIKKLVNEEQKPGAYEVEFQPVCQLKAGDYISTKKMILLK